MKYKSIKTKYLIYAGLLTAFILRVFNLNYQGLWNDELYTAVSSHPRLSIIDVVDFLKRDIHPPLHNILTNLWTKTFSYSDTSLRMFNIVLGVFGTLSIYHLAKELFNKKVAIYAFIFSIVNFYLISYSQEVRAYGMLFLLGNYSFYFFIKLIKQELTIKNSIWYVIATTSMLYTHYFSLFIVAGQFFSFFLFMNWGNFMKKKWQYIVTFALPNLIFLLWVPYILDNLEKEKGNWRDEASLSLVFKYLHDFFNDYLIASISLVLLLITMLYLVFKKRIKNKNVDSFYKDALFPLGVLVVWIVSYFLIPYVKSSFSFSMMFNRYFLPLVAPILILLAFYVSKLPSKRTRQSIVAAFAIYSLFLLFLNKNPYFEYTHTYRENVKELKEIDPDAHVFYISKNWHYFEHYLRLNHFNKSRKNFNAFKKIVLDDTPPDEYYVLLNLRPIPAKYKDGIPVVDGYEKAETKVFRNMYNLKCTQRIKYVKKKAPIAKVALNDTIQ